MADETTVSLIDRLRRSVAVVRPAAWAMLVVVVAAWVAHLTWQWREAAIIAVFGACLLAAAPVFIAGRYRLSAEFALSEVRVVVGQPATGSLVVTNRGTRSAPPSTVHLPVGESRADFDLPRLAAQAEHDELFTIPTTRRTVLDVGPVETVRADPFGLVERRQRLTDARELYVHPLTVAVEGSAAGLVRDLEGQTTRFLTDSDMSFHALRDYVPGDDRRYIHWRHSARTGDLMVRQFEQTRRSHLLILLSTRAGDYADEDQFELAVSIAGSLGVQVLRDGQSLTAVTSGQPLATVTPYRFLDALSGVEPDLDIRPVSEAVRRLRGEAQTVSVAVIITGSTAGAREIRRAHRFLPPDVRPICVRADERTSTSVRRLGPIDVLSVARLDELSSSFRSLAR